MEIGTLLLRVVVGTTLAAHGAQKLFGWFGGPGLDQLGRQMEGLGFVPGRRHARLAGVTEFGSGALLVAGLLTPLAASVVLSVMVVAALSVHARGGFFLANGGYEYNLVLGIAGISLAFTGPGPLSLDALLEWPRAGVESGLAAVVIGLAAATMSLVGRRQPSGAAIQ